MVLGWLRFKGWREEVVLAKELVWKREEADGRQ